MTREPSDTLEVYDLSTNNAVIRAPNRRFPGILIQGDSLHSLVEHAREICALLEGASEEARDSAAYLLESLEDKQQHYERVLLANGFTLPYFEEGSDSRRE